MGVADDRHGSRQRAVHQSALKEQGLGLVSHHLRPPRDGLVDLANFEREQNDRALHVAGEGPRMNGALGRVRSAPRARRGGESG
jgi:hypothetical protein